MDASSQGGDAVKGPVPDQTPLARLLVPRQNLVRCTRWLIRLPCRRHYLVSMITFLLELLRLLPLSSSAATASSPSKTSPCASSSPSTSERRPGRSSARWIVYSWSDWPEPGPAGGRLWSSSRPRPSYDGSTDASASTWAQLSGQSTRGRPCINAEIAALVRKMAAANPFRGCASHPRGTLEARYRCRRAHRLPAHAEAAPPALSDLAHVPRQQCP